MNKIDLTDLQNPINNELSDFNLFFKNELSSDKKLLDYALRFILSQKGKKIRPMLVLLSAKLSGLISERSFRGASLVELLHTATLVHDDVVDEAEKRRGLPSLNKIWGNKISVLVGDFLLSKGLMIAVSHNEFDFLRTITNTVKRMSEGELLQIYKAKKLDIDEEIYFKIISDKTASLFSTCCEIGAISATNNSEKITALKNYGENLGISFQIKDDILDFIGKTKIFGKVQGGDIKEKKLTLPLIYALANSDSSKRKSIIKKIRTGNSANIKEIIDFVIESKGIEYSQKIAFEYSEKAKNCLNIFEDSDSKSSLIKLVNYVIDREK